MISQVINGIAFGIGFAISNHVMNYYTDKINNYIEQFDKKK